MIRHTYTVAATDIAPKRVVPLTVGNTAIRTQY